MFAEGTVYIDKLANVMWQYINCHWIRQVDFVFPATIYTPHTFTGPLQISELILPHSNVDAALSPFVALVPPTSNVRITGATNVAIHGIHRNLDGRVLFLTNVMSTHTVTLYHLSILAPVGNRIVLPNAVATVVIAPGGTALLIYDSAVPAWRLVP